MRVSTSGSTGKESRGRSRLDVAQTPSASNTPACAETTPDCPLSDADPFGQRLDQGAMPDEHERPRDPALVVEAVHIAGHAREEPMEDTSVRLTLVGEMRELALREDRTATRDCDAVRGILRQLDRLGECPSKTGAQAFHGLAGAGGAALVGLVGDLPTGVPGEY